MSLGSSLFLVMRNGANAALNTTKHRNSCCGVNYVCQVGFTHIHIHFHIRPRAEKNWTEEQSAKCFNHCLETIKGY